MFWEKGKAPTLAFRLLSLAVERARGYTAVPGHSPIGVAKDVLGDICESISQFRPLRRARRLKATATPGISICSQTPQNDKKNCQGQIGRAGFAVALCREGGRSPGFGLVGWSIAWRSAVRPRRGATSHSFSNDTTTLLFTLPRVPRSNRDAQLSQPRHHPCLVLAAAMSRDSISEERETMKLFWGKMDTHAGCRFMP